MFPLPRSAPARVTALQADNDHTTHSLTVSWERPVGVYDGYRLQLLDEAGVLQANRSVSAESRSERLEGLTSGKWYRVRVVTLSGGVLSPEATAEGQTRESLRHATEQLHPVDVCSAAFEPLCLSAVQVRLQSVISPSLRSTPPLSPSRGARRTATWTTTSCRFTASPRKRPIREAGRSIIIIRWV